MLARGDGWELHLGDALTILPEIPAKSHDLVICDPPYGVGISYDSCSDSHPAADYGLWCGQWFAEVRRISRKFVVIFPGHAHFATWLRISQPSGVGCWHKPGCPSGGGSFRWCEWEPWLLWTKGGAWCGYSDTITAPLVSHGQKDTGGIPNPKPPKLYAELLKRLKPESVLDPFVGSGTSGIESLKAGIPWTGIELSPAYHETASERLRLVAGEATSQLTRPGLFDIPQSISASPDVLSPAS